VCVRDAERVFIDKKPSWRCERVLWARVTVEIERVWEREESCSLKSVC